MVATSSSQTMAFKIITISTIKPTSTCTGTVVTIAETGVLLPGENTPIPIDMLSSFLVDYTDVSVIARTRIITVPLSAASTETVTMPQEPETSPGILSPIPEQSACGDSSCISAADNRPVSSRAMVQVSQHPPGEVPAQPIVPVAQGTSNQLRWSLIWLPFEILFTVVFLLV
jgi:hypothetical protein